MPTRRRCRLNRIDRAGLLAAPSLKRRWVLAVPHSTQVSQVKRAAYDVKKFIQKIEQALAALDARGQHQINLGRMQHDPSLASTVRAAVSGSPTSAVSETMAAPLLELSRGIREIRRVLRGGDEAEDGAVRGQPARLRRPLERGRRGAGT